MDGRRPEHMASPNGPLPTRPPYRVFPRDAWAARLECDVSTSNHHQPLGPFACIC